MSSEKNHNLVKGILEPVNENFQTYEITYALKVGRAEYNDFKVNSLQAEQKICHIWSFNHKVFNITNYSHRGVTVNNIVLRFKEIKELKNNDTIYFLKGPDIPEREWIKYIFKTRPLPDDYFESLESEEESYLFTYWIFYREYSESDSSEISAQESDSEENSDDSESSESSQQTEEEKKSISNSQNEVNIEQKAIKRLFSETEFPDNNKSERIKTECDNVIQTCPICLEPLYDPICLIPCLHNICQDCSKKGKKFDFKCPECREDIMTMRPNFALRETNEKLIKAALEAKKGNEIIQQLFGDIPPAEKNQAEKPIEKPAEDQKANSKIEKIKKSLENKVSEERKIYSEDEKVEKKSGKISEKSTIKKQKINKCEGCGSSGLTKTASNYNYTFIGTKSGQISFKKSQEILSLCESQGIEVSDIWREMRIKCSDQETEFDLPNGKVKFKHGIRFCNSCMNKIWFQMLDMYLENKQDKKEEDFNNVQSKLSQLFKK